MAHENDGHRARLRERMMKEGLAAFQDHEVLELLLFQYQPRKDTNKLAHKLLDAFGCLAGVLDASPQQLMTVDGVSEVTACNLAMLKEVWRRYKNSEINRMSLDGLRSIVRYANGLVSESYNERVVAVYLDHATKYMYREVFDSVSNEHVPVEVKQIVSTAVRVGAAGVMLFHCHVKGACRPSESDITFTEQLNFALASINVVLLEHIIFNNDNDYYSFYVHGDIAAMQQNYKKLHG